MRRHFCGYDEMEVKFTIDATRAHYDTSRNGIEAAGGVPPAEGAVASVYWIDGLFDYQASITVVPSQLVNKIPSMDFICLKSVFTEEMNNMKHLYPDLFSFFPPTYQLPDEYRQFHIAHTELCGKEHEAVTWVVKPRKGSCGNGITLINSSHEASYIERPSVAQLYIDPYLIDGLKFDFRFYILVASLQPLRGYLFKEGIARFCTEPYQSPSRKSREHKFCHLTNTAVNKMSSIPPEQFTKTAEEVFTRLGYRRNYLWKEICNTAAALVAGLSSAMIAAAGKRIDKCFHILGLDIILDRELHPKVLELNDRPSLAVTVPFELEMKTKLIKESLMIVTGQTGWEESWDDLKLSEDPSLQPLIMTKHKSKIPIWLPGTPQEIVHPPNDGINEELRQQKKRRHSYLVELGKMKRFNIYA